MSLELHAMRCGTIDIAAAALLEGAEGRLLTPVMSYLIRHPKGDVIFDAGLGTAWNPHCPGWHKHGAEPMRHAYTKMGLTCDLGDGEDLGARLETYGTDPRSIDFVVGSHLHFDHCGGFDLLPNARLVIQRREWHAGTRETEKFGYHPFEFDLGHDRREVEGEHDLFGDGTIVCIPTYGHTPGHQSLRVKLDDRHVVLTSDACYLRETLERNALPSKGACFDQDSLAANLVLFRRLEQTGDVLLFGHDPDQWAILNDDGAARKITTADIIRARALQAENRS